MTTRKMQLAHKRREVLKLIIRMMTKSLTSMRLEKEMASQAKKNTISLPVFALITKMTSLIPT